MHALLLSLALGQATPAGTATPPPPEVPADASPEAGPAPGPAPTGAPAPPVRRAVDGRPLRAVEVIRLPDGGFSATLDGVPVAGAAFYRAVLRPDLAARSEEAAHDRTALRIAGGLAPLAGLGIGWVAGRSQQWPLPPCVEASPGTLDCHAHDQVAATNESAMKTALVAGGLTGLAAGAVFWLLGSAIHPLQPSADEAEALLKAYRARAAPVPDPGPAPRPAGASLRLEAAPGAARLAFRFRF